MQFYLVDLEKKVKQRIMPTAGDTAERDQDVREKKISVNQMLAGRVTSFKYN